MTLAQSIGSRLKAARIRSGKSLRALQKECNLGNASLSGYELGHNLPGAAALVKLCRALSISADELLGLTQPQKRRPPCALMTHSAAIASNCAALKKLTDSGMEVIVVEDQNFEVSLRMLEKVRGETDGVRIARENRAKCNRLTDAQREELVKEGMKIVKKGKP